MIFPCNLMQALQSADMMERMSRPKPVEGAPLVRVSSPYIDEDKRQAEIDAAVREGLRRTSIAHGRHVRTIAASILALDNPTSYDNFECQSGLANIQTAWREAHP